jgi:hypothetical protein
MFVPAGQPFAFLAGVVGVFVLDVDVVAAFVPVVVDGAFDGMFPEPHAVSAPTVRTEKTRNVKNGRIKRILTRSPLGVENIEVTYAVMSQMDCQGVLPAEVGAVARAL